MARKGLSEEVQVERTSKNVWSLENGGRIRSKALWGRGGE